MAPGTELPVTFVPGSVRCSSALCLFFFLISFYFGVVPLFSFFTMFFLYINGIKYPMMTANISNKSPDLVESIVLICILLTQMWRHQMTSLISKFDTICKFFSKQAEIWTQKYDCDIVNNNTWTTPSCNGNYRLHKCVTIIINSRFTKNDLELKMTL